MCGRLRTVWFLKFKLFMSIKTIRILFPQISQFKGLVQYMINLIPLVLSKKLFI